LESLNDALEKFGATVEAKRLFDGEAVEISTIRLIFDDLVYENFITFVPESFRGLYTYDYVKRVISGVYPKNYVELVVFALYVAAIVFSNPTVDNAIVWIRESGQYIDVVDFEMWQGAIGTVERSLQETIHNRRS